MSQTMLRRVLRAPALRAALIQVLVFLPMLCLVYLLARAGWRLAPYQVALLQGALAAACCPVFKLAPWWCAIELLFPLALLGANTLHLPPLLFFVIFLLLLLLFWSTFRTQVPFYPSGPRAREAVLEALQKRNNICLIDIGSGFGGLVLELAGLRPDIVCSGIELAPLPWFVSRLRARLRGGPNPANFLLGDYEKLDFATYDVVFAYLSPAAMETLWRKASTEMQAGSLLLSYEFKIPSHPPDKTIAATAGAPALYVWSF